jgi:hypothetical protein
LARPLAAWRTQLDIDGGKCPDIQGAKWKRTCGTASGVGGEIVHQIALFRALFALALAEMRRLLVQINATEHDDFIGKEFKFKNNLSRRLWPL